VDERVDANVPCSGLSPKMMPSTARSILRDREQGRARPSCCTAVGSP
jgi:hypothetical protein